MTALGWFVYMVPILLLVVVFVITLRRGSLGGWKNRDVISAVTGLVMGLACANTLINVAPGWLSSAMNVNAPAVVRWLILVGPIAVASAIAVSWLVLLWRKRLKVRPTTDERTEAIYAKCLRNCSLVVFAVVLTNSLMEHDTLDRYWLFALTWGAFVMFYASYFFYSFRRA